MFITLIIVTGEIQKIDKRVRWLSPDAYVYFATARLKRSNKGSNKEENKGEIIFFMGETGRLTSPRLRGERHHEILRANDHFSHVAATLLLGDVRRASRRHTERIIYTTTYTPQLTVPVNLQLPFHRFFVRSFDVLPPTIPFYLARVSKSYKEMYC